MVKSSIEKEDIFLKGFDPTNESFPEKYELPKDQVVYSEHPIQSIEKCKKDPSRIPITISRNDQIVGFFVLHGWLGVQQYYDNDKAILVRAFSINLDDQGKGIASKSIKQLPSFVKKNFPDKDEIILAVNLQNDVAQHLYRKNGFMDKGITAIGSKGLMNSLHYDLNQLDS